MSDYISREAAKMRVVEALGQGKSPYNAIVMLSAADVRENNRGEWKKTVGENGVTSACRCSLCGFEDNRYSLFNYCPNCGAQMEVNE